MFIREVTKKFKNSKKEYLQHRLCESYRTPAGPRQRIILHLGTLKLQKEELKELADTIESIVNNQKLLYPVNKKIKKLAQHYANIILLKRLNEVSEDDYIDQRHHPAPHYESIDVHSLKNSDARTIGAEHIAISQMREYKFLDLVKRLNFTKKQIENAAVLIAGRLVHPSSELETARWARETSGIGEFLGTDLSKLSDQALHRTGDLLFKNQEIIEQYLSERARETFSLDDKIILYDLTNTYFESSKKGSNIAFFANSKDKRFDCPLVTLALVVDALGFPKLSKVFKGNESEPYTLERILDELSRLNPVPDLFRKTVVIDAGIATEDNLRMMIGKKYDYIAVSRKSTYDRSFWEDEEWEEIKLSNGKDKLSIKSERTENEVFLLCHSERKESTEESIFKRRTLSFEKSINETNDKLKRKRTVKAYEKIIERIGRLKEKYGVGHFYDIEIAHEKGIALNITLKKKDKIELEKETFGNYVLRTNRADLIDEDISKIHRTLTMIEQAFQWMKSDLGLRPVEHQLDKRINSHLFTTVLSYHILAPIIYRAGKSEVIPHGWKSIKNILSTHMRLISSFMTEEGYRIDVRNSTTPTTKQMEIYKALGITPYPFKNKFSKIKAKKNNVVPRKSEKKM